MEKHLTWSDGMYKLFGYSKQIGTPLSFHIYLHQVAADHKNIILNKFQDCLKNQDNFEAEYVIKTRSGIQKIVFTKAKFIAEGKDSGRVIGITRDITALRNFETEQARNINELNRSNRQLEEFAYVASHDLQEPIRKVSMFCDRLRGKLAGLADAEAEQYLDRIQSASANMRELVDNLLEYSRANRGTNGFIRIDLQNILDQVLSDLELRISETKSMIRTVGKLPIVDGVETELKQVFSNLLSNAIKFRKHGQPAEITVNCCELAQVEKNKHNLSADQNYFKIDISDKGIGFDSQDSYKIFEVFQRLHSKTAYPGSGIGLSICKKIVENHNGVIFANSYPELGSTFTIILPENHF
jgi:light-regulated signal transduction histidine kinase (bacteriophytochrome)